MCDVCVLVIGEMKVQIYVLKNELDYQQSALNLLLNFAAACFTAIFFSIVSLSVPPNFLCRQPVRIFVEKSTCKAQPTLQRVV